MIPSAKELAWRPVAKGADQGLGVNRWSKVRAEILRAGIKKRHAGACRSKSKKAGCVVQRPRYFPCFAYQSALIGVKLFHFSGRSSRAKIAVTGQTGTQAPQSMHSVGWMYSCVSASNAGSSLRGWMQSTGQTSTHAVSFVPMHGSAIT